MTARLANAKSRDDDAMAWSLANDLLGVASVWRSETVRKRNLAGV
jgi:hypothetical protein